MPAPDTNAPKLAREIEALEQKALDQGLSDANAMHLAFKRKWLEFAGRDVVLVIQGKGVIERPDQPAPARLVEVHDAVAADLLVFAPRRNQRVREATPDEVKAYRAHVKAQQDEARKVIAQGQARVAQEQVNALIGTIGQVGAPVQPQPIPAPVPGPVEPPEEPLVVEVGPGAPDVATPAPPREAHTHEVGLISTAKQAEALRDGGFDTVESLADADPDELAKVKGIGVRTAARLVVAAAEYLAKLED